MQKKSTKKHMSRKNRSTPLSQRQQAAIRKAGLVVPITSTDEQQFAATQKHWYAKLAAEGFKDLEWVDHRTGRGQNSDFLRNSLIGGKAYHAGRELYYQLASNYLTHCKNLKGPSRFLWKHHASGRTYEEIVPLYKKRFRQSISIYTVYYKLQHLAKLCYIWNSKQAEGLLVKRQEDKQAVEESALAEFMLEEYNWVINKEFAAQTADKKRR